MLAMSNSTSVRIEDLGRQGDGGRGRLLGLSLHRQQACPRLTPSDRTRSGLFGQVVREGVVTVYVPSGAEPPITRDRNVRLGA